MMDVGLICGVPSFQDSWKWTKGLGKEDGGLPIFREAAAKCSLSLHLRPSLLASGVTCGRRARGLAKAAMFFGGGAKGKLLFLGGAHPGS